MTDKPMTLPELSAAATQGEWRIWREPIQTPADAIEELTQQVMQTDPMLGHIVLLDAGGKCPASTGCGPTSDANAAFIVALVNAYRSGQLVERDGVDFVGANTLPTEYVRWLSSIEVDVRVHDLTADEVARLVAAVAPERDAVEGAVEALEARVAKLREALTLAANRMDVMALAVIHENTARRYEWHEWAITAREAIGGAA